ncbi:MAG: hypothetical protein U0231_01275 [Nitrospiraceae bacterium]
MIRTRGGWLGLWLAILCASLSSAYTQAAVPDQQGWRLYTNARFGFSVRYPDTWQMGKPLPDGIGVTLLPPVEHSLVALSGHMNLLEGTSQDRRQTLEEFAAAHRRIITELFQKKNVALTWRKDQETTLAGFPAKRLSFTYQDERSVHMVEVHLFSLGRNEGRGVRIKMPATSQKELEPAIAAMLAGYQPGRDQNAVSPIVPKQQSQ